MLRQIGLRVNCGLVFAFSAIDGSLGHLSGQEVPAGRDALAIAGPDARFATRGHISTMAAVWAEVCGHWLSRPDYRPRQGPSLQYYPPVFAGMTGNGGDEIWVAIGG